MGTNELRTLLLSVSYLRLCKEAKAAAISKKPPASTTRRLFWCCQNGAKRDILCVAAKQKRDYRVVSLVIPTPTPEWPFDGLRTVPRRRRGEL